MKKNFKLLSLIAIGSALCLGVTALSIASPGVLSSQFLYRKEANVSLGTIEFDKSNSQRSGGTNTTTGQTQNGNEIICKVTGNDTSQNTGHVGAVLNDTEMHFYESDGKTEYVFEDIDILEMTFTSSVTPRSPSFHLIGFYTDGEAFCLDAYGTSSNATRKLNFTNMKNVARLYVKFTYSNTRILDKVVLTYNCESKSQTGVTIATAPTTTTYNEGQSFDPTGMVVKADYSNGSSIATDHYTISPSGALSTSDTFVTINCGGFTVTQPITVNTASYSLNGDYSSSVNTTLRFNTDGTGQYLYGNETLSFTYSISGNKVTFTYTSGDNTNFGSYRLFKGGESPSPNTTGIIDSDNVVRVATYNMFDSATTRTFTKA